MSMNEACNVAKNQLVLKGKPLLPAAFSPVNSNTCPCYYIYLSAFYSFLFKFFFTSIKWKEKCRDYVGADWLRNVLVPAILQLCFNFSWPLPNMLFTAVPLSGSLLDSAFLIGYFYYYYLYLFVNIPIHSSVPGWKTRVCFQHRIFRGLAFTHLTCFHTSFAISVKVDW